MAALGRSILPCLLMASAAVAGAADVTLHIQLDTAGGVSVTTVSQHGNQLFAPIMAGVMGCKGRMSADESVFGHFRCPDALRRDGLSLEGVFDPGPIARQLAPTDEIELTLTYPHLGFESSTAAFVTEVVGPRVMQTGRIPAHAIVPIRIRFGYRSGQLAGIYAPLLAMALGLTFVTLLAGKHGFAHLQRSIFILGTTLWLGAAWRLEATEPIRILLAGTPLAVLAVTILECLTPLLCVAIGAALNSRPRAGSTPGSRFQEVFWGYGMVMFPLASGMAAIPFVAEDGAVMDAVPWLAGTVISVFLCRYRLRSMAGSTMRQLSAGALSDRVAELAAKAGHRNARVYIYSSTRSQMWNAFSLLGGSIALTAPLVTSLSKREVDGVVGHELSHFRHGRHSAWVALVAAVVLFKTALISLVGIPGGGLPIPEVLLAVVFFVSLYSARKREFAADAGAVALTGDPRAMISGLARIARHNRQPLEFGALVEWFSTHPSTHNRIRAIGAGARLEAAEVQSSCLADDPGESYTIPSDEPGSLFNESWRAANSTRYGHAILLSTPMAGLSIALLVGAMPAAGVAHYIVGLLLGCGIAKLITEAVMGRGYARLGRKLARKLGVQGALVGFAPGDQPRLFKGYRYRDLGFLWFEGGRLYYRSERTAIELGASDVVEVRMVLAAPAAWMGLQPMVRFRNPESGELKAFILQPLDFGVTGSSLFAKIDRWRTAHAEGAAGTTRVSGFEDIAGEPIRPVALGVTARGFRLSGGLTILGSMLAGWPSRISGWYALTIAASAYAAMMLPLVLCRWQSRAAGLQTGVDTD
jgi:Zn-dependent protease with chaperone function